MLLGLWLDQPIWLMFTLLALPFAGVVVTVCLLTNLRWTRPAVLWAGTGIVPAYFTAISTLLALLTGFVASDAWERQRQAARVVQAERVNARGVYDLSLASASDMSGIRAALSSYLDALIKDEWPRMSEGAYSNGAGQALSHLLEKVADPTISAEAGTATHAALLGAVMALRAARGERLALADAKSDESKWVTLLVLAGLTLVAIGLVHIEQTRAQATTMIMFSVAMITTLGVIAIHERPFDGPMAVSAAPLQQARSVMFPGAL